MMLAYCHIGTKKFDRHNGSYQVCFFNFSSSWHQSDIRFKQHSVFSLLDLRQYLHDKDAGNYDASDKETQNANKAEHLLVT